ncbi:MAG: hypothetical protein E6R03_12075 [Hyphomicrobiaceae bacterium]|nr:MAG: hypothetical protein E6R03_12075 [Hyphomicrobiaceae bacterium]
MGFLKSALEGVIFFLTYVVYMVQPFIFIGIWCTLIVLSQFLVSRERRSASQFLRAVLIGVPIGILFGSAVQEHGHGPATAAVLGCAVSILAEQILNGDLPRRLLEKIMDKRV